MWDADRVFDVVVAGGGISGTMAAMAAAREGATVLLVERYTALGGMATLGLVQPITTWGLHQSYVISGTGRRILEELAQSAPGAATPMSTYGPVCDAEHLKRDLESRALQAGVHILYHTWIRKAERDGERLSLVVALTKEGDIRIRGKVFVDATGDGDLAAFAGVPQVELDRAHELQGMTLIMILSGVDRDAELSPEQTAKVAGKVNRRGVTMFKHPRPGTYVVNMSEVNGLNPLDVQDLTRATIECRKQCWEILELCRGELTGFENAYIEQIAPALGVRESRHVRGQYVLGAGDVQEGKSFEDVVARAGCPIDMHVTNVDKHYRGIRKSYGIPYRCLFSETVPNLLLSGRCISADPVAHSSLRRMAPGFALGEAAGIAAAMAQDAADVRRVDVAALQRRLRDYGAILEPEA